MPEWAAKIHMCVRALLNEGETRKTTKGEEGKEGKRKGKDSISGAEEGGSFESDTVHRLCLMIALRWSASRRKPASLPLILSFGFGRGGGGGLAWRRLLVFGAGLRFPIAVYPFSYDWSPPIPPLVRHAEMR